MEYKSSKCHPAISSLHVRKNIILTRAAKYRNLLEVEPVLVLISNELPHLPLVTFLQSSHYLETKGDWPTARSQKKWTRTEEIFLSGPGCVAGTRGF
jgi:hypothetical protein